MSGRPLLVPAPFRRGSGRMSICTPAPAGRRCGCRGGRRPGMPAAGFTEGTYREMVIATRGAGNGNRAGIRFGIRWDDGQRPKRTLLPLVAISAALARGAAPPTRARCRSPPRRSTSSWSPSPRRVDAAERLTVRLGGTVGEPLGIVGGFTASVPRARDQAPASARARCARSAATARWTSRATPAPTRPPPPPTCCAPRPAPMPPPSTAPAWASRCWTRAPSTLGGLGRPGALVRGPDFSSEGGDRELAGLDTFGHGTHLAGLISGHDPLSGFQGVAPGARVVSVKVAGADGVTSLAQVLAGMEWVRRAPRRPGPEHPRAQPLARHQRRGRLPPRLPRLGGRAAVEGRHRRRRRGRQRGRRTRTRSTCRRPTRT